MIQVTVPLGDEAFDTHQGTRFRLEILVLIRVLPPSGERCVKQADRMVGRTAIGAAAPPFAALR